MRKRKKTGVHGTLEMIPLAWKFNSKQLLSKTLNSRRNIIETRAVLNIVKTDRKWIPEGKRGGLELTVLETEAHSVSLKWCLLSNRKANDDIVANTQKVKSIEEGRGLILLTFSQKLMKLELKLKFVFCLFLGTEVFVKRNF